MMNLCDELRSTGYYEKPLTEMLLARGIDQQSGRNHMNAGECRECDQSRSCLLTTPARRTWRPCQTRGNQLRTDDVHDWDYHLAMKDLGIPAQSIGAIVTAIRLDNST